MELYIQMFQHSYLYLQQIFGSAKLINKFAAGIGMNAETFECKAAP
ncbi:hypothetical protein HL033_02590 [Neoehrlichia mikurensis]|nr:hypothetical protein [Neoehrlichia mikurensis]QXK93339.1 hypothetical protein HL033_02590 [Neoehrlichia mikurensis]